MVRLKDIAQQAGVSVMTVSKVMRDAPDISLATKSRVRLLAQQLGYVPDAMAQALRTRKTRLLGVVIPSIANPFLVRVIMAIEQRAYEMGFEMVLGQSLNQPEREETIVRRLIGRRIDGLLIAPVYRLEPSAPIFDELRRRAVPTVLLGHTAPFCADFIAVDSNDVQASQAATQHLINLGHRRIAFFTGPTSAPWAQQRLEGYRRALREAQLASDDRLIFNAGGTIEEGEKAAQQLLAESPGATAIQAVNDLVALGVAKVLLGHGLKIPQAISLVGFGNCLTAEYGLVPLTTVRLPKFRLGQTAMQLLERCLRGERPPSQRLSSELIVRASTAAPAPPAPPSAQAAPQRPTEVTSD